LGGDEFIILLPEAGPEAAQAAATKMQGALLDEMQSHNWPVTFSIGTLTCLDGRLTPDELIVKADDLMYSVKKNGKSGIAYGIVGG
jgi:diguanylate cyclase (GGDEF)-like protein